MEAELKSCTKKARHHLPAWPTNHSVNFIYLFLIEHLMRLILTRHGETIENAQGIHQGHLPGKLSDLGIKQAKKLAKRLKDEKIDVIYSSDLARAADTAKEILKFHPNTPIKFVKELREKDAGDFQGKKKGESGLSKNANLNHGETFKQLFDRAEKFLHEILHIHINDIVLFVGHNKINKAILCVITDRPSKEIEDMEHLKNASISIFDIDEKKNHKIHVFNCIKHLD